MALNILPIRMLLVFILLSGLHSSSSARLSFQSDGPNPMNVRYEQWIRKYKRVYKNEDQKAMRSKIFKENVEFIESFNGRTGSNPPYKLSINEFADLENHEFVSARNGYKIPHSKKKSGTHFRYENVTDVPDSMDWRKNGAVTPVKDQGQCGSCWAFSTVGSVEGINQIKTGKLVSLSEQELVDCDVTSVNSGCNGGELDDAFQFVIRNKGLTTESNYQYQGIDGSCDKQKEASTAAQITGYEDVPQNEEVALLKAVANQPVSVTIDASGSAFQFYSSGVFSGDCGTDLDHAVTAVGYGKTDNGTKYWLVKNSWGTDWGEEGYIRFLRDVQAKEGSCGIAMGASYPTA